MINEYWTQQSFLKTVVANHEIDIENRIKNQKNIILRVGLKCNRSFLMGEEVVVKYHLLPVSLRNEETQPKD